ncbi:hypothetical protein [Kitasatospora sp. NPDC004289]
MPSQDAYQLRVCDLRTDATLAILPVEGASYDDYIGRTGSLSATVPIPTEDLAREARESLIPGRTMLHLERAGQIAWAGPLWTITPALNQRTGPQLQIQAACLESIYRSHRYFDITAGYTDADQFEIARSIMYYAQLGAPGGDLGLEADFFLMSGVLRDRTYEATDLNYIGVLLDQLAAVQNGFEWRIQVYADSAGVRHRYFRLGYPKLTTSSETVLSLPGPVLAYALPQDATTFATKWQSRGASVNDDQTQRSYPMLTDPVTRDDLIALGWPLLDGSSDYSSVEDPAVLLEHATADLARASTPLTIPSVTIRTDPGQQPALGSSVRLRITDTWNPAPGLNSRYRVVGYRVSPEERGRPETAELYLEAA